MKNLILKAFPIFTALLLTLTACANSQDSDVVEIETPAFILFYTDN